ncbi:TPA: hypothetical protein RHY41_004388 [Escherichia coli]|nr:hypothetical protein [Escherichia coli]EJD4214355.1 hypothetical protein [Escherichia coli]HBB7044599.1 hypothetical protein [Escherichia coli]HDV2374287.1 hypothetical protein [Escherichia coli]
MDEIERLTEQVHILEEQANDYDGNDPRRAELFKAAGKVKNQIVTLLNQKGQLPSRQVSAEPKIPDPAEYFNNGNSVIDEYFNNLTPDMERYFTTREDMFDGAPSMPSPTPTESRVSEDEEQRQMRIRILHAIGVF